jgi:hypothetical protein
MEDFDIDKDSFLQSLDCFLSCYKNIGQKTAEYKRFAENVYSVDFEKASYYSNVFFERNNSCFGKVLERYDDEVIICILKISSNCQISCTRFHNDNAFEKAIKIASRYDYDKLNNLLESALTHCYYPVVTDEKIKSISEIINPLMIDKSQFRYEEYFEDPYDKKFVEFINYVDSLIIPVKIQYKNTNLHTSCQLLDKESRDHTNPSHPWKILFIHNNISYYGEQDTMYRSFLFLSDCIEHNDDEPFVLSGSITKQSMNLYIDGSCRGDFDISDIDYSDILQFMKFIEQYPTKTIFLEKLETSIIDYFETGYNNNEILRDLIADQEMVDLALRCRLKYLYLYLHNKKIIMNCIS